ncbi:MAG: undecaprenyl/decaprenyl-phosphate alpha-N-acetylglucosaminyl 1-phosphate transferase [Chloroflexi bacterium]|nr:undecaprenyl/decaprenyl-phosphate alpha-N-acetylglucosaminyl 1-phosphate transferase [Chloroflexota bacterium]
MQILIALASFVIAFIVSAVCMPWVMRLCIARGWVIHPGGRRTHEGVMPTIGGISIYIGFVVAILVMWGVGFAVPEFKRTERDELRLWLMLAGATLTFVVMWIDDVVELHWIPKFIVNIIAGLIAVGPFIWDHQLYPDALGALTEPRGIVFLGFNIPFMEYFSFYALSPWVAIIVTVFWLGWMVNTVNWADGVDGLAGGVSMIAGLMLGIHALLLDPAQYTVAIVPLALAGAATGFLLFNFPPAKIFMGDAGAELLGFVLGVSAILGGAKVATVLLVLGVWILDVAWLIVSRPLAGRLPTRSGRDHLHQRLTDGGFSARQIALYFYSISIIFGLLGITDIGTTGKLISLILLFLVGAGTIGYAMRIQPRAS